MKKLIFCILLLTVPAATALMAQQPAQPANAATQGNFVPDDDGGLTEIVPANFQGTTSRQSSALPVMKSVQQVSIFLGAAWGDQEVRSRQTRLLDLAGNRSKPALAELQNKSVEVLPAATRVEDFSDLSRSVINDL